VPVSAVDYNQMVGCNSWKVDSLLPLRVASARNCNRLGADEALERVQRAFDTRKDEQRRSPETDEQHQMVRDFVASGRK
jgi:hypothetical protein